MLRPTWIEINIDHFKENMLRVRQIIQPGIRMMVVVKANAYGHGAVRVALAAQQNGAEYLAVATLDEAVVLREAGLKAPLLVLGTSLPGDSAEAAVKYDITLALCTVDLAKALSQAAERMGKVATAHVKIDTGMGRIGVRPNEASRFMSEIKFLSGLKLTGIFSHFAVAEDPNDPYTNTQFCRFRTALHELAESGYNIPTRHLANSAAILQFPETHLDMVRAGCILYGVWPDDQMERKIEVKSTLSLKTRIVFLKEMQVGESIGYGRTYRTGSRTLVATLPVGYGDGYRRCMSDKAFVLVRGVRAPVIGRICMDQCMVDVSRVPGVSLGDEVVLIGEQGKEQIGADEVARWAGTMAPDVFAGFAARVPRIYV